MRDGDIERIAHLILKWEGWLRDPSNADMKLSFNEIGFLLRLADEHPNIPLAPDLHARLQAEYDRMKKLQN